MSALWPASTKRSENSSSKSWLVVGDLGWCVEVLQAHGGVEAGGAGAPLGGGGVAAGDLVGEDELEELGVAQVAGPGQGEPLGEGGEQLAELDPAQQRPQLGGDDRRGRAHAAPPAVSWPGAAGRWPVAKWAASRANRGGVCRGTAARPCGSCWSSVARSSIRPISGTLMASASSARAQARLDRPRPPFADQAEQRVDLAHLGPRQRVVQQRRGVGADRRARRRRPGRCRWSRSRIA